VDWSVGMGGVEMIWSPLLCPEDEDDSISTFATNVTCDTDIKFCVTIRGYRNSTRFMELGCGDDVNNMTLGCTNVTGRGDFVEYGFSDVWMCLCDSDRCISASKQTIPAVFTCAFVVLALVIL